MARLDDLAPLLGRAAGDGVGFHQGVVLSWDPVTATNTVAVGGSVLPNVPILNTNEALLLQPGAVVGLLTWKSSWFILGRITVPGTPDAASALRMVGDRIVAASVSENESTTSTTYADMATPGPAITVPIAKSGRAIVIIGASISVGTDDTGDASFVGAGPGGATLNQPTTPFGVSSNSAAGAISVSGSQANLLTNLAQGDWTFTMKYRSSNGDPVNIGNRTIIAMPF